MNHAWEFDHESDSETAFHAQVEPAELLRRGREILDHMKAAAPAAVNEMCFTGLARIAAAGEPSCLGCFIQAQDRLQWVWQALHHGNYWSEISATGVVATGGDAAAAFRAAKEGQEAGVPARLRTYLPALLAYVEAGDLASAFEVLLFTSGILPAWHLTARRWNPTAGVGMRTSAWFVLE